MTPLPDLPGLALAACPAEEAGRALDGGDLGALSRAERAVLASLPAEKRRRDWLAGRLAAKRALRAHLAEDQGVALSEDRIEVLNGPTGSPYCLLAGAGPKLSAPSFSISHSEPGGLAAVSRRGGPIGVDWETIEERPERVFSFYASDAERQDGWGESPAERTRLWALKEAVLKTLGLGLAADPRQVRVPRRPNAGPWAPQLSGDARERWDVMGRPALSLASWDQPGAVVAVSHGG